MTSENQEISVTAEESQNKTNSITNEVSENNNLGNYDDDMKKYTKVDNLDEDSVVDSGRFFLVSFISPEGVMNCNMRGLKIRTYKNKVVFQSLEEAKTAADEINKKDKYFHVFVGETGKWMGWDPNPDDRNFVEEEKWQNEEQNELMQGMRKREENKLKELNALVGKKKDIINKEKKVHDKRVKDALTKNAEDFKNNKSSENVNASPSVNSVNDESQPSVVTEEQKNAEVKQILNNAKKNHNPNLVKERLRKKLREKESKTTPSVSLEERNKALSEYETSEQTKTKLDENIKKLNSILQKAKQKEENKE